MDNLTTQIMGQPLFMYSAGGTQYPVLLNMITELRAGGAPRVQCQGSGQHHAVIDLVQPISCTTLQTTSRQCYDNNVQLPRYNMEAAKLGYGAVAPSLCRSPNPTCI